jgi:hypothetical protein
MFRVDESLEFGLCRKSDFQIEKKIPYKFCKTCVDIGVRGGVMVKALRYKPAGRGFDSQWCHWKFSGT